MIGNPVLRLTGVTKSFGGVEVLRGIDLEIHPGVRHLIIGPNGAGKTTLFNVISGISLASSGQIEFLGSEVGELGAYRRARLGLGRTFQVASLFPPLSVWENLLLAASAPGITKVSAALGRERARQALEIANLDAKAHAPVQQLSYGEQRRLEIAVTLASQPKVLLLDEPMAGLTQEERQTLADRIVEMSSEITVVLIEHDLEIALHIAERVTVLHLGRVVADGQPRAVLADPAVRRIYLG